MEAAQEVTQMLTITNNGTSELVVRGTAVAAPFYCDYSGTLAPGQNAVTEIRFAPVAGGDFSETLTFDVTGAFEGINTIDLTGTGIALQEGMRQSGFDIVISKKLPINNMWDYSYSQSLFLQSELNMAGKSIYKLSYYYDGENAFANDIAVYMGDTEATTVTGWTPFNELVKVYSGPFPLSYGEGWGT